MRDLGGQRGRDGDEMAVAAAVMDWHLPAFARVAGVAITLRHEEVQGVAPVHQHTWKWGAEGGAHTAKIRDSSPRAWCPPNLGPLALTCLPVLPENQVSVVQRSRTANMRPLLTIVGHVEGDTALGGEAQCFGERVSPLLGCPPPRVPPLSLPGAGTRRECGPWC